MQIKSARIQRDASRGLETQGAWPGPGLGSPSPGVRRLGWEGSVMSGGRRASQEPPATPEQVREQSSASLSGLFDISERLHFVLLNASPLVVRGEQGVLSAFNSQSLDFTEEVRSVLDILGR